MRISDWSSDVCSSDLLDQQAELRADPSKLTLAIEEMMRAYAAVTTFRTVTRETEFKGVKMMPGDKVAMSTAITSRDPETWTNPNEEIGRASCRERVCQSV